MRTKRPTFSEDAKASPRVWIFQANPKKYNIFESLATEQEEYWNLNQHLTHVHTGDQVLIWVSGEDAGVYAVGTVITEPISRSDSSTGLNYWQQSEDGLKIKARVKVRYNKCLLDKPLLKEYLLADPILAGLKILRCAMGTNFSVTSEEWIAFQEWL